MSLFGDLFAKAKGWFNRTFRRAGVKPPIAPTPREIKELVLKPPEEPKMMWRQTVAINYVLQHRYYAYRITSWHKTKEDAERDTKALQQRCAYFVSKRVGYGENEWWFDETIIKKAIHDDAISALEIEQVPYDEKLIGKEEVADEFLLSRRKKKGAKYEKTD